MKYLDWIITTPAHDYFGAISDARIMDADGSFLPQLSFNPVAPEGYRDWRVPPIQCKDGALVSVQASEHMYCTPRNYDGPWTHVEAGFPSVIPPASWHEHAEDGGRNIKSDIRSAWRWAFSDFEFYNVNGYRYRLGWVWHYLKRVWRKIINAQLLYTVYPYIPVELIREYIEAHGGEDTEKSFAQLEGWKAN